MSTYCRVLRAMSGEIWAIEPQTLDRIVAFMEILASGSRVPDEAIAALQTQVQPRSAGASGNDVAVLPFYGTIFHRASQVNRMSGGTSIQELRAMFRQAVADPQIGSILLEVDSAGGMVGGVQELAQEIFEARGRKRIVALANTMAASAAYWIASAAAELYVTPSGSVGSIGVFAIHRDQSAKDEADGVRYTYISTGKYKTEGNPHEPLSDDARIAAQEQVETAFATMTAEIARFRGVPRNAVLREFGEGRPVLAMDAKAHGMVDGVATFDQVVARLQARRGRPAGISADDGSIGIAADRSGTEAGSAPIDPSPIDAPPEPAANDAGGSPRPESGPAPGDSLDPMRKRLRLRRR